MKANYEILIECGVCKELIDKDEACAVLEHTYVCNPKFHPECLQEWNNQGFVRSEFYD